MSEDIRTKGGVKRVAVNTQARAIDQHSRRAVYNVAGGNLRKPGLQHPRKRVIGALIGTPKDRKDCANSDGHINVRRTVEWVEDDGILRVRRGVAEEYRVLILFRSNDADSFALGETINQALVRINIKFLLCLALDVDRT